MKTKRTNQPRKWSQILCLGPLYILQLSYGMNSGFPAILTPQLKNNCSSFSINGNEESWVVSLDNFITPLICLISGKLQLTFGPKKVITLTCIPYIIAWLITYFAQSVWWIYVARLCVGISNALISTTVYTVEIASKDLRGSLSLFEAVLRCLGCLITYGLGYVFKKDWHFIPMVAIGPPIIAFCLSFLLPESPIQLLRKNKLKSAERIIKKIYGPKYDHQTHLTLAQLDLKEYQDKIIAQDKRSSAISKHKRFQMPEVYQPFLIIVGLSVIQQFSGMSVMRSYVVKIFNDVFQNDPDSEHCEIDDMAYLAAILIGTMRLISSLMLSKLLLHFRRRVMYFWSAGVTIFSLFTFATCNYLLLDLTKSNILKNIIPWISLASAGLLVFGVQLGVQTLPLLLSGELFPSDVRPIFKGIARSIQCILLVICLKLYPILQKSALHEFGTFYFYGSFLLIALPFVYLLLPETKDLSLESIQYYFKPQKTIFYIDLEKDEDAI